MGEAADGKAEANDLRGWAQENCSGAESTVGKGQARGLIIRWLRDQPTFSSRSSISLIIYHNSARSMTYVSGEYVSALRATIAADDKRTSVLTGFSIHRFCKKKKGPMQIGPVSPFDLRDLLYLSRSHFQHRRMPSRPVAHRAWGVARAPNNSVLVLLFSFVQEVPPSSVRRMIPPSPTAKAD